MTREDLEKAIENGETVWCYDAENNAIEELYLSKENKYKIEEINCIANSQKEFYLIINDGWIYLLSILFHTKAEAEHYLHHANVTRTETLPFLTWEEFKSGKDFKFTGKDNHEYLFSRTYDTIILFIINCNEILFSYNLTEEDFYKAYDECVRLFKGEE